MTPAPPLRVLLVAACTTSLHPDATYCLSLMKYSQRYGLDVLVPGLHPVLRACSLEPLELLGKQVRQYAVYGMYDPRIRRMFRRTACLSSGMRSCCTASVLAADRVCLRTAVPLPWPLL